jgi:hypothetical protein
VRQHGERRERIHAGTHLAAQIKKLFEKKDSTMDSWWKWGNKPVRKRMTIGNLISSALIILLTFATFFYLFVASLSGDLFWLW